MKISRVALLSSLFSIALISSAAAQGTVTPGVQQTGQNVIGLLGIFGTIVDTIIGLLVTAALAVFFWGLVRYIFNLGGGKGHEEGKKLMQYGILALFVMVSIWGIIAFIQSFLGIGTAAPGSTRVLVPQR